MQNRTVLVTGGGGFVGSNLATHLAEDNDIIVLDDGYTGSAKTVPEDVLYVEGSVLDEDLPADVDVLFHFASLSSRELHQQHPDRGCRVNVEGFVNTIEQVRATGCDTVVYASTASVYRDTAESPTEDRSVEARTAYRASELARERYAEYYAHHHDMSVAGMRLSSVYQEFGKEDKHDPDYPNTIDQYAGSIASGESPVLFGAGSQTRDFVHNDDVARACERAADHQLSGIYNVGTGVSHSFNRVVEMVNEILGTDIDPEYIECPFEEYDHDRSVDVSKFTAATDWKPAIDLLNGIELVCEPYMSD